jgi:hypothetical protein
MNREDWVLLALHFGGARGLSPVQLQKSLFLLRMEVPEVGSDYYEFIPHNYGPFSKQIYQDAEQMATRGLVAIERGPESHAIFLITAAGQLRIAVIDREAPIRARNYLRSAVEWTQRQTFSGLVRAIYTKYPDYKINSVFQ